MRVCVIDQLIVSEPMREFLLGGSVKLVCTSACPL